MYGVSKFYFNPLSVALTIYKYYEIENSQGHNVIASVLFVIS